MRNTDLFNTIIAVAELVFAAYVAGTQNRPSYKSRQQTEPLHDGGFIGLTYSSVAVVARL